MNTQVKLDSVGPNSVGGGETAALNLIYEYLLSLYKQDSFYSYIHVNQITTAELNEIVIRDGRKIYCNVRFPEISDLIQKTVAEKNRIRLDILHEGLVRIAKKEKKLDIDTLETIRTEILKNDFSFDIVLKSVLNKKNQDLIAKIIVRPEIDKFYFYVVIEKKEQVKCTIQFYTGKATTFYFDQLFKYTIWSTTELGEEEFMIGGLNKEFSLHFLASTCGIRRINYTNFDSPPSYDMYRVDILAHKMKEAFENKLTSLPPNIKGFFE